MNNQLRKHSADAPKLTAGHNARLLLAVGLLLSACGSDSTETEASQTAETASSTQTDSTSTTADEAEETEDSRETGTALSEGPQNVGEHGPFSNADLDHDGTVTRAELDQFMDGALEREIGLIAFFDLYDDDGDDVLDADELATVDPPYAFDGTDADADGVVTLLEVTEYANEDGRSYRLIGLSEFFDLVDTDGNDEASPQEIEAAHESGLLARF